MTEVNTELARFNMIEQQIRPWRVSDTQTLELLASVPRERFVPEAYRNLAFSDLEIPLGQGEVMMAPKIEARLLQSLAVKPLERILEIGTGSGFLTACLAKLGGHVVSVEIVPEFSQRAQQILTGMGYENIEFRVGDAANGWDQDGSFDVIVVTGSLPVLPEELKHCLNNDGRLFVVTGESPIMQAQLIRRLSTQEWQSETLFETDLPALQNAVYPQGFSL